MLLYRCSSGFASPHLSLDVVMIWSGWSPEVWPIQIKIDNSRHSPSNPPVSWEWFGNFHAEQLFSIWGYSLMSTGFMLRDGIDHTTYQEDQHLLCGKPLSAIARSVIREKNRVHSCLNNNPWAFPSPRSLHKTILQVTGFLNIFCTVAPLVFEPDTTRKLWMEVPHKIPKGDFKFH